MTLAHVMGIPIEESVLQLAPIGALTLTAAGIAGRSVVGRLASWLRHPQEPNEAER